MVRTEAGAGRVEAHEDAGLSTGPPGAAMPGGLPRSPRGEDGTERRAAVRRRMRRGEATAGRRAALQLRKCQAALARGAEPQAG